jgi:hypothetical protein
MAEALAQAYQQLGITRTRTTPYFPSGDPAERMIGAILRVLRALCHDNGESWDTQLPIALMALRSQINDSTGTSSYELLYGTPMRLPIDHLFGTEPEHRPTALHGLATRLQRLREKVALHEQAARARNKKNYDKHRTSVSFQVGDRVLLHFPTSTKLELHWRGPYEVLRRVQGAPNIYCVGDANNKDVHMVNVRRMRKYHTLPADLLPQASGRPASDGKANNEVDPPRDGHQWEVDCLMGKKKAKGVLYYLVRWSGIDRQTGEPYDPTWEPAHNIAPDLIQDYERLTSGFKRH